MLYAAAAALAPVLLSSLLKIRFLEHHAGYHAGFLLL